MKINISYKGHYSFLALKDNIDMLKNCLIDCGYKISVTNSLKEKFNFIYEGHHPDNYDLILKELRNNKNKKILICTEELTSHKFLPKTFFTFNHHKINWLKYKKKKVQHFFYLFLLNFKFSIFYFSNKYNIEIKIKKFFSSFDIKKILNLDNEVILWKERYNFFLKTLNLYDGLISTYDWINYKDLKLKNFFFLPHLFSKKDLIYKKKNNLNKSFDLLFTGQVNKFRISFVNKIKKKYKVKILNIADDDKRKFYIDRSKIFLGLFKNEFQALSSVNRTFFCIKNRIMLLSQSPVINDNFDNKKYLFTEKNFYKKIDNILSNYKNNHIEFKNYCDFIIKKFQSKDYKVEIINFLNNCL